MKIHWSAIALACTLVATGSMAAETQDEWEYMITPYLFLPALERSVAGRYQLRPRA